MVQILVLTDCTPGDSPEVMIQHPQIAMGQQLWVLLECRNQTVLYCINYKCLVIVYLLTGLM